MADLVLLYGDPLTQGGNAADGDHRKVTISSGAGVTTLTITSPEVDHSSLARRWAEIPRPGARPLLHDGGPPNRKVRLTAIMYADPPGHIAEELRVLMFGHTSAPEVQVSYGRLEAMPAVVTDLKVTTRQRVDGSNEPYWAEVDIELTDKPPEPRTVVAVPIPSAAPPPPAPPAETPPSRTYTVQRGDTLSAIAQRFYGNAGRYPEIAAANGIRNPNLIYPGQVFRIP